MYEQLPTVMSVDDVRALAELAHAGQVDKIGTAYFAHVQAVAAGLAPFGDDLVMAGLLHDVVEDTEWTAERLLAARVPARVVAIVEAVTNQDGVSYEDKIRRITRDPLATLVKIADNAHNSRPDRAARLPAAKRELLAAKYRAARAVLWPASRRSDIEAIVRIVNPALLAEIDEHVACTSAKGAGSPAGSTEPAPVTSQKGRGGHDGEVGDGGSAADR